MSQKHRQLHLNAFLYGTGHHEASWRLPEARPELNLDFNHVLQIVHTAERGLMDSVFLADGYTGRSNKLEPFTELAALASRTKHIGLIATVGTTYNEPFHVARKFASLDHISKGRAGWNIVTGSASAAHNFGREEHPEHSLRYEEADEFVEVVKKLWDSWEDDAVINDKASGVRIVQDKAITAGNIIGSKVRLTSLARRRATLCWCRRARLRAARNSQPRLRRLYLPPTKALRARRSSTRT
ncbi:hypothetical protein JCM16163A_18260 [Paenibacillus sp. YK5]